MTHVHFIGIGGSGLSAIARLLKESGYTVTGSDRALSPFATDLQAAGVTIYIGHHPRNIQGADWVVRSSAIPDDNPEVVAAGHARHPCLQAGRFPRQMDGRQNRNRRGRDARQDHDHRHDRFRIVGTGPRPILHRRRCDEQLWRQCPRRKR